MDLVPQPVFIVLQMAPFLLLIFALKGLVFDPLLDYLEERHRRITGFSSQAKSMEAEAEQQAREIEAQLAAARTSIPEMRTSMLNNASAQESQIVGQARARAEEQAARFREELAVSQREASNALRAEVETLSQDIASRVLGRPVA
jgi:F-type H+-transporting ATPase subunit b